ncbi:MAG: FRG domain-containing protein [Adhaeribacter sp.]
MVKKENSTRKSIKSVPEFISAIYEKIKELENITRLESEFKSLAWFRGESSEDFKLLPTLYRIENGGFPYCNDIQEQECYKFHRIEQNIDASFDRKASIFFANKRIENTPWNRYFLKQHYKVKTRLLDWTENALYALFFAVKDAKPEKPRKPKEKTKYKQEDGKVWILLPYKLNNYSVNQYTEKSFPYYNILTCKNLGKKKDLFKDNFFNHTELLRQYYRMSFEKRNAYPLAIFPTHLDERMSAQQACFTLFGNKTNGLESNDSKEKFLDCVYIDAKSKLKIQKELRLLGISNYSIYPDLDGLGLTINYDNEYGLYDAQIHNELANIK